MHTYDQLRKIFGKYAGQEVALVEKTRTIESKSRGKYDVTRLELANEKDPVVEALNETAKENGLILRIWWPGVMGTMEMRGDRVNVWLEQGADKKWRVSDSFELR